MKTVIKGKNYDVSKSDTFFVVHVSPIKGRHSRVTAVAYFADDDFDGSKAGDVKVSWPSLGEVSMEHALDFAMAIHQAASFAQAAASTMAEVTKEAKG